MDEPKYVTPENLRELERWACAWHSEAVKAEFISMSYHPDTATLDRLRLTSRPDCRPQRPLARASTASTKATLLRLPVWRRNHMSSNNLDDSTGFNPRC